MPSHRISHAVARFVKAFQKKQPAELIETTDAQYTTTKATHTHGATQATTALPTTFFKQVKSLLERAEKHHSADPTRYSSASSRASLWSPSSTTPTNSPAGTNDQRASRKRQHFDTTRASTGPSDASERYVRLALMLAPDAAPASSMRSVALTSIVETLLQLWDVVLQQLRSDDSLDNSTRAAALTLLKAIAQRREFDAVLHALASGACSPHRAARSLSRTRSRRTSSVRLERAGSFRVAPVIAAAMPPPAAKKASRRSFLKRSKRASAVPNASAPLLCALAQRYLLLHQASLQLTEDAVVAAANATAPLPAMKLVHELLMTLLAVSYIRVPILRESMLAALERAMTAAPVTQSVALPSEFEHAANESPLGLFKWLQTALPACRASLAPCHRDDFWTASVRFINTVLSDADARFMLCGRVIEHVPAAALQISGGRVEWQRVPGVSMLARFVLWATASVVQHQQAKALETATPRDDDRVERASVKPARGSKSSSSSQAAPASPTAFFLTQSLALAAAAPSLRHALLFTVLTNTNALLPHHVEICLQHIERLLLAFPAYFRDEPLGSSVDATVDTALLARVFATLLASEHFEILKATQLFLLQHSSRFSHALRAALLRVYEREFRRLFLHWHRDVRYCYFHVLLYLTYAGNRTVLCARSDASVLGAEAAQLFEIPGLVRTPAMAAWDVFDAPLHALLTRYSRLTKKPSPQRTAAISSKGAVAQRPSQFRTSMTHAPAHVALSDAVAWVDDVPLTVLARSVPEYRRLVQTYFQCAKQLSVHEPVPVPAFYVKSAAPHS